MRQSNVCSPAQNQACLLITSRLYDRRGLDCTSPLPLFNSLAHLVHLTATSPKIREILTRDGGLERLVRILRDFVANPPPVQDVGGFYGLLPPIPLGNSGTTSAIASMNPSMTPSHSYYGVSMPGLGQPGPTFPASHALASNPAFPTDPNQSLAFDGLDQSQQPARALNDPRPFDRDAAQRFSLAFQSIVNVGVRGSEAIRSRVVQAGTLEVVASILEAWLINKGFPLVMPRRGKRRDANPDNALTDPNGIPAPLTAQSTGDADTDERMEEDALDGITQPSRPMVPLRNRTSASSSHGSSRARTEGRSGRPGSSSTANGTTRGSTSSSRASSSTTRPGSSSRASSSANQTTPRHSHSSLGAGYTAASSASAGQASSASSANASTSSLVPTPSGPSPSPTEQQAVQAPISRGRSGTIVANRSHANGHGDSSREHSTDEMENDADTERTGGRSGANTEDEDMDAESSNNEVEMETANNSATNSDGNTDTIPSAPGTARVIHRPVAVADPQALSPHAHADSLSLPTNGPGMGMGIGMGMGMGLEVDVLAAVNMVMAHDGVAAFEGTQFGGDAANAAAAEAIARAGREGIMEEETPRAVLRNMSERVHPGAMGAAAAGELGQVDEEMRDAQANPQTQRSPSRTPSRSRATSENPMNVDGPTPTHTTIGMPPVNPIGPPDTRATTFEDTVALGGGEATIGGPPDPLGVPRLIPNQINPHDLGPHGPGAAAATAQAIAAANAAAVNANRNRFRVMVGDAGPFRQEDVLRALQLLAYLTKYPHVRQEFYKKRVHLPPGMGVPLGSGGGERVAGMQMNVGRLDAMTPGTTLAQVAPVSAAIASGQMPQITTLFSLVERFTFRPSMSHLSINPSLMIPTIPPEIQSWAAVIMRNACRKDDSQGGIRQCANMTCGKWERSPREFAKCRRCRKAKYCGKECQSKAWSMGHRYWCSAREGEPGQVPPENLDHDNDDASSTTAVNGDTTLDNTATAAGAATGMGIGIAPGGGVGLVPLNNPQVQAGAAPTPHGTRGRNPFPANGPANRGPVIAGYAWDAPPPATTTRQPGTSTAQPSTAASTSNATNSNGRERRRDGTPTGSASGGSSRFTRGLTERIRALGAAGNPAPVTTAIMQHMGIQNPAPSVIAPADPNTVRPRAWDRLFGRDGPPASMLAANPELAPRDSQSAQPNEGMQHVRPQRPSRSSSGHSGHGVPPMGPFGPGDADQMRQYLSSSSRNRGVLNLPGQLEENGASASSSTTQAPTDLSGMVRNNLVLAGQPGPSSLPSGSHMNNVNVVGMRAASISGPSGSTSATARAGFATRNGGAGGSLTMLDPANATGSMWNAYATDSDQGME